MPFYVKKPIPVEAVKWTGSNLREVADFMGTHQPTQEWERAKVGPIKIFTLEGVMTANVGDWIIKGVKGEFYPCKPDIFDATYEPAKPRALG